MIKKLLTVFALTVLTLIFFGTSNVKGAVQKESLEDIIKVKVGDEWENLKINKYTDGEDVIYKRENDKEGDFTELKKEKDSQDTSIIKIIRKGYKYNKNWESEFALDSENDLYIATKIAIDCVKNGTSENDIMNIYQVVDEASEEQRKRAEKILEAVAKLVKEGYHGTYINYEIVQVDKEGDLEAVDEEYYSQTYNIGFKNATMKEYKVMSKNSDDVSDFYIAGIEGKEEKQKFTAEDKKFRIMIPTQYHEEPFTLNVSFVVTFITENLCEETNETGTYYIYGNKEKEINLHLFYNNKKSNLLLGFADEDTGEAVKGCMVEINGNKIIPGADGKIYMREIGKGKISGNMLYIPDDYYIENGAFEIDIPYGKTVEEDIILKRKKGKLEVTTHSSKAKYEIYDSNFERIYEGETDDEGKLELDNLRTGKYVLRQTEIDGNYELAEDKIFSIEYQQTTYIDIYNLEKELEDDKGKEDEDEGDDGKKGEIEDEHNDDNEEGGKKDESDSGENNGQNNGEQDNEKNKEDENLNQGEDEIDEEGKGTETDDKVEDNEVGDKVGEDNGIEDGDNGEENKKHDEGTDNKIEDENRENNDKGDSETKEDENEIDDKEESKEEKENSEKEDNEENTKDILDGEDSNIESENEKKEDEEEPGFSGEINNEHSNDKSKEDKNESLANGEERVNYNENQDEGLSSGQEEGNSKENMQFKCETEEAEDIQYTKVSNEGYQNNKGLEKLPRTGEDYFKIKIFLIDLFVFLSFLIVLNLFNKCYQRN